MSSIKQSSYTVMTLAEWMNGHDDKLDAVVEALCRIFSLPNATVVQMYVEDEIEHQARLLLVVDQEQIMALARWNWIQAHKKIMPVYLGVRPNSHDPDLHYLLVTTVIDRLRADRHRCERTDIKGILLQYSPVDRLMSRVLRDLDLPPHASRNESFKERLGTKASLRSTFVDLESSSV